jgi:hypothetical protein
MYTGYMPSLSKIENENRIRATDGRYIRESIQDSALKKNDDEHDGFKDETFVVLPVVPREYFGSSKAPKRKTTTTSNGRKGDNISTTKSTTKNSLY